MPVIGGPSTQWAAEVQQYAAEIDSQYPPGPDSSGKIVDFGKDYIAYMDAHPSLSPALVYQTFEARIALLVSIPSGIGKAIATGAGATAGLGGAGAAATNSLYPAWLQGFLGANGVIRIAEAVIGIVIAAVALDKLLGGNAGIATTIAKVAK